MVNKIIWSLTCVCFSLSALLSLVGAISVIQLFISMFPFIMPVYMGWWNDY